MGTLAFRCNSFTFFETRGANTARDMSTRIFARRFEVTSTNSYLVLLFVSFLFFCVRHALIVPQYEPFHCSAPLFHYECTDSTMYILVSHNFLGLV